MKHTDKKAKVKAAKRIKAEAKKKAKAKRAAAKKGEQEVKPAAKKGGAKTKGKRAAEDESGEKADD